MLQIDRQDFIKSSKNSLNDQIYIVLIGRCGKKVQKTLSNETAKGG